MYISAQDENVDLEEIIKKNFEGVDDAIINNPQFRQELKNALKYLTKKEGQEYLAPLSVFKSDDGKSVVIRGEVRKNPDVAEPQLKDNKYFNQVTFSVGESGFLEVTQSEGSFYKTADYVKVAPDSDIAKQVKGNENYYLHTLPTVISVYHNHRSYTQDGIELQHATYQDDYPLSTPFESKNELIGQTVNYHTPTAWHFNTHPGPAKFENHPITTNLFRYTNRLSVVTAYKKDGKDGELSTKREAYDYVQSPEYPEYINCSPVKLRDFSNINHPITKEFGEKYPGLTESQIEMEVTKSFYNALENSKTKKYNPDLVDVIKERTKIGLKNRHGYDIEPEEVEEQMTK